MPDSDLTTAFVRAYRRSEALPAADRYDANCGEYPSTPLCKLLEALHTIGDRRAVERVSERLIQGVSHIDLGAESAAGELAAVVGTLVRIGRIDQAEQIALRITHPWNQGEVYASMARAFTLTGDLPRAERAVNAILDADTRSNAWIDLVSALIEVRDLSRALRTAQSAWESIAACTESEIQPRKQHHLLQVLDGGGRWAKPRVAGEAAKAVQAAEAAETLTDPCDRDRGYVSAIFALLVTGQRDRAADLIPRIADQSFGKAALLGLASVDDFDERLRLAAEITDPEARSTAHKDLVDLMAEVGEFERAELTVTSIEVPFSRADALIRLAGFMALTGDRASAREMLQDAERVAAAIVEPALRKFIREYVVEVLIDIGDFEQAEITALAVAEECGPVIMLSGLAWEMAKAGDLAGARRVVERAEPFTAASTDPTRRAWGFNWLAQVMVATGNLDDATRLLWEAIPVEPWYDTVATVAAVAPDAVRAVAEELLSNQ
ncbi:MAG TPA: hypothetical protein VLL08_29385 [Kineosporiaceae bacterium]|nr:hypothetical protein [Kineosporiaceae bacterium]